MAKTVHPLTGVQLNPIEIERKSLTRKEAVTAFILRLQGHKYNHIAQYLGTNTHRLGEIFRGEKFAGSESEARELIASGV